MAGGVYATTATDLVKLSPKTGTELWRVTPGESITSSPIVDPDGSIRISTAGGGSAWQYTYGPDGAVEGRIPIFGRLITRRAPSSVWGELSVFPPNPSVIQVEGRAMNGSVGFSLDEPTLGKHLLYAPFHVGGSMGAVAAYDVDAPCPDGVCNPVWTGGGNTDTPVSIGPDGTVYVAGNINSGNSVWAVDGETGALKWTHFGFEALGLAVGGDRVFVTQDDDNGVHLDALDARTGAVVWSTPGVGGSVVVGGGVVYVADGSTLYAFAAAGCGAPTCSPLWTTTTDAGTISLAVAGGHLYATSSTGLTAYGLP